MRRRYFAPLSRHGMGDPNWPTCAVMPRTHTVYGWSSCRLSPVMTMCVSVSRTARRARVREG